jgi:hypothetical protein
MENFANLIFLLNLNFKVLFIVKIFSVHNMNYDVIFSNDHFSRLYPCTYFKIKIRWPKLYFEQFFIDNFIF